MATIPDALLTLLNEAGARNSKSDMALLQAIHDHAGSLGASCSAKESALPVTSGLKLTEAAVMTEAIPVQEAYKSGYQIKLIAPGKGSSAFYPAEVLKRDGPTVFKAGTHVYMNHPTKAEEAARPEGDVKNLAAVLTKDAYWLESHKEGPGLYSEIKPFADHAQSIDEKAPYVGMSIRAAGIAESGQKKDGLPILKQLTSAESVDIVTRAGAGGMILTEAAKAATPQEVSEMDAAEVTKLVEAAVSKATAPLLAETALLKERAAKGDAVLEATKLLEKVTLPQSAKARVIEQAVANLPMKDGALDVAKFTETVNAFAKSEGEYIGSFSGNRVQGMGSAPAVDPKETERLKEAAVRTQAQAEEVFAGFGMSEAAAKITALSFKEAA